MGDQLIELQRQLLRRRDKGDTLYAFAFDYPTLFRLLPRRYRYVVRLSVSPPLRRPPSSPSPPYPHYLYMFLA